MTADLLGGDTSLWDGSVGEQPWNAKRACPLLNGRHSACVVIRIRSYAEVGGYLTPVIRQCVVLPVAPSDARYHRLDTCPTSKPEPSVSHFPRSGRKRT